MLSSGLDFLYTWNNYRPIYRGAYSLVEEISITQVNLQVSNYYKLQKMSKVL